MINAAVSVLTSLIGSCSCWRREWLLLLFLSPSVLPGQNPSITRLEPASFVIGGETLVEIEGENLLEASSLLTSFSATAKVELRSPAMARFSVLIPQEASPGIGALRVVSSNGVSSWRLVVVDHLSPRASPTNHGALAGAWKVQPPGNLTGKSRERGFDFYELSLDKNQRLGLEVVAQRIGSAMDPVFRLLNSKGGEFLFLEDSPEAGVDIKTELQGARREKLFLEIRDTRYQASPQHFYVLRAAPPPLSPLPFLQDKLPRTRAKSDLPLQTVQEPANGAEQAYPVTLPFRLHGAFEKPKDRDLFRFEAGANEQWVFRGRTRSLGSPCDLLMEILDQKEKSIRTLDLNAAEETGLTNTFTEAGTYYLAIEELNRTGGPRHFYQIAAEKLNGSFDLSLEVDSVRAEPGKTFGLKVSVVRRDFSGPIEFELEEGAGLAIVENKILTGKTNETTLKIQLPETDAPGEFRMFRLVGKGTNSLGGVIRHASTWPALKKTFPLMLVPPEPLNGVVVMGVGRH